MISITKIFRFEAAHALYNYPGSCARLHGHSYELHVTVQETKPSDDFIDGLGIMIDFKELKACVLEGAVKELDHKLILSKAYLATTKGQFSAEELVVFDHEPTAENLLIFLRNQIGSKLPNSFQLRSLKLWETRDSYAEWSL
jgi:6-pyruvoyltetrahydropterin/6-carboxytetrahydropterin synthase